MDEELVLMSMEERLAIIMLNNSPNNLINDDFLNALEKQLLSAKKNGARAIMVSSKLKHFSAGADPSFLLKPSSNNDPMRLINIIENIDIPTVAAIKGGALGGGFELTLGCDFIISADTARIGLVEASVGLMPLAGGVQRLVNRVGLSRAKEITMFARRYDPATLEKWGAINLVVPELQLLSSAISFSKQLSQGPSIALKEIKKIAHITANKGIDRADKSMKKAINNVLTSQDAKKGISYLAGNTQNISFKGN
jgi:enoyl-CoA hydratase/carnithine racemase